MARISKEEQYKHEGIAWVFDQIEKGRTLEDVREEAKRRGAYHIPINLTKTEERDFVQRVKTNCINTVLALALHVLIDEFEFGNRRRGDNPGRLDRFRARFLQKCDCMCEGYASWKDIQEELANQHGVLIEMKWDELWSR